MLFITNRFPKQNIRTRVGRNFTFDLKNNAPSNSMFFCERNGPEKHTELGSAAFLAELKDCGYRQILLYVHGFSNLPEDVFKAAGEMQKLCNKAKKNEVLVVPLIWPCDAEGAIVGRYWDDQRAADLSGYSFARVLERFIDWRNDEKANPEDDPSLKRINLLSHSMGNRVMRETLHRWNKYALPRGVPMIFRNTFMVAADVVNEALRQGETGELITHASRNVVVYYASDDLALRASKAANIKNRIASRRLGHTGPTDMGETLDNVYSLDCDEVNQLYDHPKGHSYFRYDQNGKKAGVVFEHIFQCLLTGRVFPDDATRRSKILE